MKDAPKPTPLGDITPYEKNARIIDAKAVEAVAKSICKYGWRAPITVDTQMTIISGHTRLQAAKHIHANKMTIHGWADASVAPVVVADDLSEQQIKEFRIADNRTAENSKWDGDLLRLELTDIGGDFISDFFEPQAMTPDTPQTPISLNLDDRAATTAYAVIKFNPDDYAEIAEVLENHPRITFAWYTAQ